MIAIIFVIVNCAAAPALPQPPAHALRPASALERQKKGIPNTIEIKLKIEEIILEEVVKKGTGLGVDDVVKILAPKYRKVSDADLRTLITEVVQDYENLDMRISGLKDVILLETYLINADEHFDHFNRQEAKTKTENKEKAPKKRKIRKRVEDEEKEGVGYGYGWALVEYRLAMDIISLRIKMCEARIQERVQGQPAAERLCHNDPSECFRDAEAHMKAGQYEQAVDDYELVKETALLRIERCKAAIQKRIEGLLESRYYIKEDDSHGIRITVKRRIRRAANKIIAEMNDAITKYRKQNPNKGDDKLYCLKMREFVQQFDRDFEGLVEAANNRLAFSRFMLEREDIAEIAKDFDLRIKELLQQLGYSFYPAPARPDKPILSSVLRPRPMSERGDLAEKEKILCDKYKGLWEGVKKGSDVQFSYPGKLFASIKTRHQGEVICDGGAFHCNYILIWDKKNRSGALIHSNIREGENLAKKALWKALDQLGIMIDNKRYIEENVRVFIASNTAMYSKKIHDYFSSACRALGLPQLAGHVDNIWQFHDVSFFPEEGWFISLEDEPIIDDGSSVGGVPARRILRLLDLNLQPKLLYNPMSVKLGEIEYSTLPESSI
jgi:hypothetical protein